jgi:hypothetical protein
MEKGIGASRSQNRRDWSPKAEATKTGYFDFGFPMF